MSNLLMDLMMPQPMYPEQLDERIRTLYDTSGLDQKRFAARIGVTDSNLSTWLHSDNASMQLRVLNRIASRLELIPLILKQDGIEAVVRSETNAPAFAEHVSSMLAYRLSPRSSVRTLDDVAHTKGYDVQYLVP